MSQIKTRIQSSTLLHQLVGSGSELPVAELPTVRDLIRYGLYLREISEQDRHNYSTDQLVADITKGLLAQWYRANPQFSGSFINSHVRIKTKLKAIWKQVVKVSSGRAKQDEKDKFMDKLDRLMDILTSKCIIKPCAEANCSYVCLSCIHISYACSREKKIPTI